MKIKINKTAKTAEIQTGASSFEIVDASGKTIAGNVHHIASIRARAIAKLAAAL